MRTKVFLCGVVLSATLAFALDRTYAQDAPGKPACIMTGTVSGVLVAHVELTPFDGPKHEPGLRGMHRLQQDANRFIGCSANGGSNGLRIAHHPAGPAPA